MNGHTQPEAGPSKRKYDTTNIPDEYEVYVPDERAKNTYVFTEKIRAWGPMNRGGMIGGKRKREKGELFSLRADRALLGREHNRDTADTLLANPKLIAKIDHECNVKPVRNEKYLKILQQRQLESSQTKR